MSLARRPRLLCLLCQTRAFHPSYRILAEQRSSATPSPSAATEKAATAITTANPTPNIQSAKPTDPKAPQSPTVAPTLSPLEDAPRSYGKRVEKFTPKPLTRPIGMRNPPQPGENTGIDLRTLKERRDDFANYEKHLKRRQELTSKFSRPYFRDWGNLKFHKGKTFYPPPRPFKKDLSLFFPNLYGRTLLKSHVAPRDTTPTLLNKVSLVSVFSSVWAENQTRTFTSAESSPDLDALLRQHPDVLQRVWINVEENTLKAWLIRLFVGGIRRRIGEPNWGRYFVVRKGISDDIRESIGLLNSSVGYTYLLDGECRIRWAGSGLCEEHEREGLVKAAQRLVEEQRNIVKREVS